MAQQEKAVEAEGRVATLEAEVTGLAGDKLELQVCVCGFLKGHQQSSHHSNQCSYQGKTLHGKIEDIATPFINPAKHYITLPLLLFLFLLVV